MIGLLVENGVVVNAAVFDTLHEGWVRAVGGAGIGWIHNGDGTFSAPPMPPPTADELAATERLWRDGELKRADIEISKAEDTLGAFNAETWRAYRMNLRDWPADPLFPDPASRPVAPGGV
jgi:hypothetical protein